MQIPDDKNYAFEFQGNQRASFRAASSERSIVTHNGKNIV